MFQIAQSLGYLFNKACATRQQKANEFQRSYSIYTRKNLWEIIERFEEQFSCMLHEDRL